MTFSRPAKTRILYYLKNESLSLYRRSYVPKGLVQRFRKKDFIYHLKNRTLTLSKSLENPNRGGSDFREGPFRTPGLRLVLWTSTPYTGSVKWFGVRSHLNFFFENIMLKKTRTCEYITRSLPKTSHLSRVRV